MRQRHPQAQCGGPLGLSLSQQVSPTVVSVVPPGSLTSLRPRGNTFLEPEGVLEHLPWNNLDLFLEVRVAGIVERQLVPARRQPQVPW